ncbi:methionine ABC transporter substrate-binding protein [Finegoldia magna]|uniref:Lipoprotein n=1 Tax=Finegoldia magna TaxID=1260 RepID=A0A2N6SQW6_FINMA|nr:MetQ/NlpA family ABC transporter substrate-binding protein [Finegoldia magna]MDU7385155.1 MetQ/NlpA family ABC transporter substrate-binding protein [Finegoldia magna]PMC59449.1 methionine ABC transporter substrate-binding protein [Finegoldia magna]
MKKKILLVVLALALVLTSCAKKEGKKEDGQSTTSTENKKVVIGVSPAPHKEIAEKAKEILAKEGIELEIKEFDDYVTPNTSLQEKDIDLNFYQHIPYLDNFNKERGTKIVSLGAVHLEPMGIYSKKYKSLDELKDGDEVIIPNDATNGARALKLLEDNKVIKLKENAGLEATEKDIAENPKNLKFTAVEAATIPRAYEDAAIAVINSNFALEAKLSPKKDAIAIEKSEGNPFANIIAAREEDKDNETYKKVLEAFQSDEVRKYIEEKFDGEIIPAK